MKKLNKSDKALLTELSILIDNYNDYVSKCPSHSPVYLLIDIDRVLNELKQRQIELNYRFGIIGLFHNNKPFECKNAIKT